MVIVKAVRLLAPRGTLTLRARESERLSIFAHKHQLHRWGQLTLMEETRDPRGDLRFMLRNEREVRPPADLQAMSFGVITNATSVGGIVPCERLAINQIFRSAFILIHTTIRATGYRLIDNGL